MMHGHMNIKYFKAHL